MTSLKGDLRSIMGTPFGGVGHAVLIFSRVTRAAFNSDSVVLQLHDRIEMPEEADGKFRVDGLDPGPIRIELEGGTVHNHGWNIDLPDEGVWSLTDLVDAQVDWSPAVIGRAEAAAREAREHADRAEAGADRVGTAEQVGTWASEASSSASSAASARSGAVTARNAAQSARDAAEGHANRAATSESNAKTSETNAKQSETNAGDYAAVATTAATEAVDAMESASDAASSIGDSVSAAAGHADRAEQYESGAAASATSAAQSESSAATYAQTASDAADRIGTAEQVEEWADDARNSASSASLSESKAKEYRDSAATAATSAVADYAETEGSPLNVVLTSMFEPIAHKRGVTRRIYVRSTGRDEDGDGTIQAPYREIGTALDTLLNEGPVIRGSVIIDVGPGEYKGGIRLPLTRGQGQDDFVTIKGPSVGGHPNTPTAVIKQSLDTSATYGILASDGWHLWVENISIEGPFQTGLDVRSGVTLQRRNVHVDGAVIGVNLTSNIMDNSRGGIIKNCTQYGVQEMYNVIRSYTGGSGGGTIFQNCQYGIYSKVYTGGHLDNAVFEDCDIALHIDRGSANLKGVAISGATTAGIILKDAEVHNESSIVWGSGNTRRIISYGAATSESDMWGWSGLDTRTGIKPPNTMVRSTYTPVVVTGVTTATYFADWVGVLPADRITVQGRKVKVDMVGRLNTHARGDIHLQLMVAGAVAQTLTIPSGEPVGIITATWTLTCTADGNSQMLVGELKTAAGTSRNYYGVKNINLTSAARTVGVRVVPPSTSDNIEMVSAELYA